MYNIGSVSRMVVSENVLSAGVTRQPRALLKKGPALSYKTAVFKIWGGIGGNSGEFGFG